MIVLSANLSKAVPRISSGTGAALMPRWLLLALSMLATSLRYQPQAAI